MNESFPSSAVPPSAPIASPNDWRAVSREAGSHSFAAALGQFLLFGFYGQIVYTVLEIGIAGTTHGQAEAPASVMWQLFLLVLPISCAAWGGTKRDHASSNVSHPLAIAALTIAMGVLGMFNLLVLFATMMAGYC